MEISRKICYNNLGYYIKGLTGEKV